MVSSVCILAITLMVCLDSAIIKVQVFRTSLACSWTVSHCADTSITGVREPLTPAPNIIGRRANLQFWAILALKFRQCGCNRCQVTFLDTTSRDFYSPNLNLITRTLLPKCDFKPIIEFSSFTRITSALNRLLAGIAWNII